MTNRLSWCLCVALLVPAGARAADPPKPDRPRVVLVGDSIRMGYAPLVARKLEGQAIVLSVTANGGDSANVRAHLDEWVLREKPAVVHFNCGLHDLKQSRKDRRYQVDLPAYEANLKEVVARLRKEPSAALVFASPTPILDDRHVRRGADFDRREEDVRGYNAAALAVMRQAGVIVDDLHALVEQAEALDYLCSRPDVDAKRIGATGMSMGSTRAWWLAAVDERVAAAVGVACLTRYQNLIAHGGLRQHGVYDYVQGLLRHFDSEGVVALIAPRPFLALTGELDAGSPADGIKSIEEKVGAVYAALGARERFRSVRYPDVGHTYTPAMRAEMLTWFARWLKPGAEK
jgi:dienelactone hydrolase